MLQFFDVNTDYVDWLKTIDKQIPNILYASHNKFVCGVILYIDEFSYYAPVSHNKKVYQTSFPIKDDGEVISTVRPCFMFPANMGVLTLIEFEKVRKKDISYADLLAKESKYCNQHEEELIKKALSVYQIGINKQHKLNYTCCDFKKLEAAFCKRFGKKVE